MRIGAPLLDGSPSPPLAAVRRALESVRWGERVRDRAVIGAYYGLLVAAKVMHPGADVLTEVHPEFWLSEVLAVTPIGRFRCRAGTTDFDIVNPNYEFPLVHELRKRLSVRADRPIVFVDVGAHIGKYTVLAGRSLENRGIVIAIEPDPENFDSLQTNIALNRLSNVQAHNVGCWERDTTLELYRRKGNMGGHSFVDRVGAEKVTVPVKALDSVLREEGISEATVIKIDVERAEEYVIRGAQHLLAGPRPPTVFFEEHQDPQSSDTVRQLRSWGFSVKALHGITYVAEKA